MIQDYIKIRKVNVLIILFSIVAIFSTISFLTTKHISELQDQSARRLKNQLENQLRNQLAYQARRLKVQRVKLEEQQARLAKQLEIIEKKTKNLKAQLENTTKQQSSQSYRETNLVPVYYATDRKPSSQFLTSPYYTGEWQNKIDYGFAIVSIPPSHQRGQLERPWKFLFLKFDPDPQNHIVLQQPPQVLTKDDFFKRIRIKTVTGSPEVLVFIHGFNTAFDEAILRSGQLAYDLDFRGPVVSFSWPSEGALLDYGKDIRNNKLSAPHLHSLLQDIMTKVDAKKIHVIAHSMGNRVFTDVLVSLKNSMTQLNANPILNQIILAAPDIDKVDFETIIAPSIQDVGKNITLYASSKDKALKVSKKIYGGYLRAGLIAEGQIVSAEDIDIIDVSAVDGGWLEYITTNHSAYGDELIDDLFLLIRHGLEPEARNLLRSEDKQYWRMAR